MGFAIKTLDIYNPAMTLSENAKQSSGVSIGSHTGWVEALPFKTVAWLLEVAHVMVHQPP